MQYSRITFIELYKIFRNPRTYIAFSVVALVVGLIQLGSIPMVKHI